MPLASSVMAYTSPCQTAVGLGQQMAGVSVLPEFFLSFGSDRDPVERREIWAGESCLSPLSPDLTRQGVRILK